MGIICQGFQIFTHLCDCAITGVNLDLQQQLLTMQKLMSLYFIKKTTLAAALLA